MRILILFLLFTATLTAQNFKGSFHGWWGDTNWIFHFKKNGKYSKEAYGYFGDTRAEGRYKRKGNHIYILTDYKEDYGAINEYYVIDNDSTLIDMDLGFDYGYTQRPDTLSRDIPGHHSLKRTALAYLREDIAGKTIDTLSYYGVGDGYSSRQAEYNVFLFLKNSGAIPRKHEITMFATSRRIAYLTPDERKTAEHWKAYLDWLGTASSLNTMFYFEFLEATETSFLLATKNPEAQKMILFEYAGTNIPSKITFSDQNGKIIKTYTAINP